MNNQYLIEQVMQIQGYEEEQEAIDYIDENYQGEHNSITDWAENFLSDTGALDTVCDYLISYIDFDSYARDSELGGDIFVIEEGFKKIHVFWNR